MMHDHDEYDFDDADFGMVEDPILSLKRKDIKRKLKRLKQGKDRILYGGHDLSEEAISLIKANGVWTEPNVDRSSLWLGSGRNVATAVGKSLYRKVGHSGMVEFHTLLSEFYGSHAMRDLESAWHGIGEWLG